MADREALERELEELRERLSREDRLRARREDLSRQAEELRERKAALGEVLAKEEADVDALEGMSLQAILQTVLGRKEERLEQERREAVAARLRYQDACRALEDVEARYLETAGQLDQLRLDRRRYEALLEEKRARVKVLRSTDKWYGVTYREDKPQVVAAIAAMTQSGLYPERLWDI